MVIDLRRWGLLACSLCIALTLTSSGCASKRRTTRVYRPADRIMQSVGPEREYNPPTDPMESTIPQTPPAPRDADPPPPSRNTSDTPPAPPRDDFESAERPGRFSASFGPFSGWVRHASQSSDQTDDAL